MYSKIIKVCIWLVLFMYTVDIALDMTRASNSISNTVGFIIVVAAILISFKTKCLTAITLKKKKDEK